MGILPYQANIDIRDTVNYKEVMKQYNLGPNGGILTALNLFATRFDQVLGYVDKRAPELDLVFLDTPGQIEIFTWSASGTIISESLASTYPTVILYVIDTPRTTAPVTFMSNMMYACSILYKSKLPFLLVFNKTDITSHEFATKWMQDFDSFSAALKNDESYMSSLTRSMSLVLDEFYATIRTVGVSAMTGEGMESLFQAVQDLTVEYDEVYKPALEEQKKDVERKAVARKQKQMERLQRDMAADENLQRGEKVVLDGAAAAGSAAKSTPAAAAAARRLASAKLHSLGGDGIIQTRSAEQKSYVRHPDEEAEDDFDDEDDAFADEDDNDALGYEEDNRGDGEGEEEEEEYVNEEAARKDREDFEEFMARIKAEAPSVKPAAAAAKSSSSSSSSGAKKPSAAAAASRIVEDDEGAEEIDTGAKK